MPVRRRRVRYPLAEYVVRGAQMVTSGGASGVDAPAIGVEQSSVRRPAISVVAPCFNEQEVLPEFCRRTIAACRDAVGDDFELVLIDDGSRDATWSLISSLSDADRSVVGVR